MSLIVEDGSGMPNSESYLSVADATAYHLKFGNTAWGVLTTDQMEMALRKATQYLDLHYHLMWKGQKVTSWLFQTVSPNIQALDWPRADVTDADGMSIDWRALPTRLQYATAEAALIAASGEDMLPDIDTDESVGLEAEKIQVGPIVIDEQYGSAQAITKRYVRVDRYLADYINTGNMAERG